FAQGVVISPNGNGSRVTPLPGVLGPPAANLPNLDELRQRIHVPPQALMPLPSVDRSPRNPLEPWNGKKVGDPGTTSAGLLLSRRHPKGSNHPEFNRANAIVEDYSRGRRKGASPQLELAKRHHSKAAIAAPVPIGDDQYVQTFFSYALGRQPNGT